MMSFHKALGVIRERSRTRNLVIYWPWQSGKGVKEGSEAFDIVSCFDGGASQCRRELRSRNPRGEGLS